MLRLGSGPDLKAKLFALGLGLEVHSLAIQSFSLGRNQGLVAKCDFLQRLSVNFLKSQ